MRKFINIFIFLATIITIYAEEPTFRYSGDVVFFEDEEEARERIYTLKIKGKIYSYSYPVIFENGQYYLSVIEFFKAINLKNYTIEGARIEAELGRNLEKDVINFNSLDSKEYLLENGEYYLSANIFKEHFLSSIRWDDAKLEVNMNTNFSTPDAVALSLDARQRELDEDANKPVITYKGKRELIDAGNLRVNLQQNYNNDTGSGSDSDWSGYLEYSGSLLYGILNTDYDLKEHELGDVTITYSDLLRGEYELEIGAYGEHRELGLTFQKDRGYFDNGRDYTIEENVPLGSRVELLYNGIPIEIQNEEGGKVVFVNSLIKENREFVIRIYALDGKIYERTIKINKDYNLQNKGEFGYDIYMRDEHDSNRVNSQIDVYYGYTDHLTFGFGFDQIPTLIEDNYISLRTVNLQAIYGNMVAGNPYTLTYELTKGLNMARSWYTTEEGKHTDRKYNNQHRFLLDTSIKDLDITYEQYENGKYYDTSREQYLDLDYDLTDWLSLTYSYEKSKYWGSPDEDDYRYGFDISKSWNQLLISFEFEENKDNEIVKGLDLYYTGFKYFIAKLENDWDENNDYEAQLTLTNKSWDDILDYSFKVKYTPDEQVVYTLDFTLKLDNWFEVGTYLEKNGRKNTYIGIDRVINLKNPAVNMNSLENTNIKIIAFLDGNNNNKLDDGEERVSNVDVTFGTETVTTNESGVAYIYGVPSFIDYELKTSSRRPSFNSNANIIKVRGIGAAETEALIPIKPMITFMGTVDMLGYSAYDQKRIMDHLSVVITNEDRSFSKTIYPDSDGVFFIQDMLPGEYNFGLYYNGDEYNIDKQMKKLELTYTDENRGENEYNFILEKKGE